MIRSNAVGSTQSVKLYLFWSVHVFVESFEGIDVELHKLSKQIKVALQDISRCTTAVYDAEQDVLWEEGGRN